MILGFINVKIRASVKAIWSHQKKCWVCPTSVQTFDVFICRHWVIFPLKSCTNGVSQRFIWTLLLLVDFCHFFLFRRKLWFMFSFTSSLYLWRLWFTFCLFSCVSEYELFPHTMIMYQGFSRLLTLTIWDASWFLLWKTCW